MRTSTCEGRPLCWLVPHVMLVILVSVHAQAQCTWTDTVDIEGTGPSAGAPIVPSPTLQACKDSCEAISACVAVDFALPICTPLASVTSEGPLSGKTLSRKTCPTTTATATATTAATTTAIPTEQPTTIGTTEASEGTQSHTACRMVDQVGVRGVHYDPNEVSLPVDTLSAPGCQALCKVVAACVAYTSGNGQCDMHTSEGPNLITNAGYRYADKKECDGGQCCFNTEKVDTQGTGGTTEILQGTAASCSSMCGKVESCHAASFNGTTCTFFNSKPNTQADSAATYFAKDCDFGAARGSLAVTRCDATQSAHLSKLLVGCTVFVAFLLAKTG